MVTPRRVLIATFGSWGDLFPYLGLAQRLTAGNTEVRWCVNKTLGLTLRTRGARVHQVGDGLLGPGAAWEPTTRFDGWSSDRSMLVDRIAPTLAADTDRMRAVMADWSPDVVVAAVCSPAARIAALGIEIPVVTATIYPRHLRLALAGRTFARPYIAAVDAVAGGALTARFGISALAWGADLPTALLHDPALLTGPERAALAERAIPITGYPLWDDVPANPADVATLATFLDACHHPPLLVTMGSFLGYGLGTAWDAVLDAVVTTGLTAAFIGTKPKHIHAAIADRLGPHGCSVGAVPLLAPLRRSLGIVHHGGLGTTIAAITAASPPSSCPTPSTRRPTPVLSSASASAAPRPLPPCRTTCVC